MIPYPLQGPEATASDTSIKGNAIPIIGNFDARAADGTTYRVLWEAATPQEVNPATLAVGATTCPPGGTAAKGLVTEELSTNDRFMITRRARRRRRHRGQPGIRVVRHTRGAAPATLAAVQFG